MNLDPLQPSNAFHLDEVLVNQFYNSSDLQFSKGVYDAIESSIFIVDVLANGEEFCYVALNPAHERWTGIHSADLQGKTPEEILSPADAAVVRQRYSDCVH